MPTLKSHVGRIIIPMLPINRRTFDILRHEFRALRTRILNVINPLFHARVRRLQQRRHISLNVGSGGRGLADWVNIELTRHADTTLCLDIRRPLPFASGSVQRILIEHALEHVDFQSDVPRLLREFHRVLEASGTLRIVVPDAERFLQAYASGNAATWHALGWDLARLPHDIFTPMHVINHVFHQGGEHLFAYDFETLKYALQAAGFQRISRKTFRQSNDPNLAIDQEGHAPYSLYVEAVR
ncbi:MAG TPA: methyltransferase domain-containing protein [Hyphomicrobiaceae bacterium]|nr:methyltransferase domain-containing protein [Hyphomicrobiaceae bacterium]